jgi:hypothetical protein
MCWARGNTSTLTSNNTSISTKSTTSSSKTTSNSPFNEASGDRDERGVKETIMFVFQHVCLLFMFSLLEGKVHQVTG